MPRTSRLLLLALLFVLNAGLAACGTSSLDTPDVAPPDAPSSMRAAVDPEIDACSCATRPAGAVTVEAGDRIRIALQNLPEYTVTRVVPPEGTVPLFRASQSVAAAGRTVQEIEAAVAAAYEGTLDAYVTVTVVESAPRTVYVAGAVRSPKAYALRPGERLTVLQALTLAGGPAENADLYGVTIMRLHPARGAVVSSPPLDLAAVQARGDQTDNLIVLPGDTVVVPEATARQVHILGHVEDPGPLRWYDGLTLSRAITEAGGFRKFARQDRIRVVRDGGRESLAFDFTELLSGGVPDLVLRPGDVVYVDERWI